MKGNVCQSGFELYISGFPRSGNTFAVKAFLTANPGTPLRSHKHIPTFIVQSVKSGRPGMVLIRNPLDAAISWSIHRRAPVGQSLQYYSDYYSVLAPYRERLFIVSFEDVVADFGKVINGFNARWGTAYRPFENSEQNVANCMAQIEAEYTGRDGKVNERTVARPSATRAAKKEALLSQINSSSALRAELCRAQELYHFFPPQACAPAKPKHHPDSTQSIRLRPAT